MVVVHFIYIIIDYYGEMLMLIKMWFYNVYVPGCDGINRVRVSFREERRMMAVMEIMKVAVVVVVTEVVRR